MEENKKEINLFFFSPFSFEKHLFAAYDAYMSLLSADDWACLMDLDTCFLTSDAPRIMKENIENNPDIKMWTTKTNRVGNKIQNWGFTISKLSDIIDHREIAVWLAKTHRNNILTTMEPISGMVMIIQKKMWDTISKPKKDALLGIDTHISREVLKTSGIGIMEGVYTFHYYRLDKKVTDTTHLI